MVAVLILCACVLLLLLLLLLLGTELLLSVIVAVLMLGAWLKMEGWASGSTTWVEFIDELVDSIVTLGVFTILPFTT